MVLRAGVGGLALLALSLGGCAATPAVKVMTVAAPIPGAAMPAPAALERATAQHVAADKLYTVYSQNLNEGALPDQRFRGRLLNVSGLFAGTRTGFAGQEYLELGTHDADAFVYATLSPEAEGLLHTLAPGTPLQLLCIGKGMIAGSPILGECRVA
jgi:hypothetical protein